MAWLGKPCTKSTNACRFASSATYGRSLPSTISRSSVWGPVPVTLKAMVSAPGFALASRIAWRRVPAPESAVEVTV